MDGFDILKEAFRKFASKLDAEDINTRLVRTAGAGGKALVEKGMEEFPATYVKQIAQDFYSFLTSQEVADGISSGVRSFDESKVKDVLDNFLEQLKTEDVSSKLAKSLKDIAEKGSITDIENLVDSLAGQFDFNTQMAIKFFFMQSRARIEEVLDQVRGADEAQVAEIIRNLADSVPTDLVAAQVGAITQSITPDRITKQAHDIVGTLPSPTALSNIIDGVGKAAAARFNTVANAGSVGDALKALENFGGEAMDIVSKTIAQDQASKQKFDKKGGGSYKF